MDPTLAFAARFAVLGGLTVGLAAAPATPSADPRVAIVASLLAAGALTGVRPRRTRVERSRSASGGWTRNATGWFGAVVVWLGLVALAAVTAGIGIGAARLAAIDAGALDLRTGQRVSVSGFVAAVPQRDAGEVRVRIETAAGTLMVTAREPVPELAIGREVLASGAVRDPDEWERDYLERLGIRSVLVATRLELTGGRRGGIEGWLDRVRDRADAALGDGTSPAAASLLRGFVLGQDDRIDPRTVDQFKASGLAHLLAVSGQNVVLLGLLAAALLAVLGVPLRTRLLWILGLIALYVPVAGAGPSIQRAGVMGAAGVVAALASRPRSRWYAVLLAAAATLALNPRAAADVGWQLSFAAVVGILGYAGPLQALAGARGEGGKAPLRRLAVEGAALTLAATLATAPLFAHHFGSVSAAALPANLVALPAVAPVMWIGMVAAAAGQLPWLPVEPLTALAGALAGYIAQVAAWFGDPRWAQVEVEVAGGPPLAITYVALAIGAWLALRAAARRRALRPNLELRRLTPTGRAQGPGRRRGIAWARGIGVIGLALALTVLVIDARPPRSDERTQPGLRTTVLDVGQGDAILLEPRAGDPVLVDAGPPGADASARLDELGIHRLGAVVISHPQSDHAGGAAAVLERIEVARLVEAVPAPRARAAARAAGTRLANVAAGDVIRSGRLRIDVLWPPRELLRARVPDEDPNRLSLILRARWRRFELLLCGDAEAELAPIDPGAVDVLKVAHHGSADAGLPGLLERTDPELAVISVGDANPHGHPAPQTLADLAAAEVPALRTDRDGEVTIEARGRRWTVR